MDINKLNQLKEMLKETQFAIRESIKKTMYIFDRAEKEAEESGALTLAALLRHLKDDVYDALIILQGYDALRLTRAIKIIDDLMGSCGGEGGGVKVVEPVKPEGTVNKTERFCMKHRDFCIKYIDGSYEVILAKLIKAFKDRKIDINTLKEAGIDASTIEVIKRAFIVSRIVVNSVGNHLLIFVTAESNGLYSAYIAMRDYLRPICIKGTLEEVIEKIEYIRSREPDGKKRWGGKVIDPILDEVLAELRKRLSKVKASHAVAEERRVDKEKVRQERQLIMEALG